MKFYVPYRMSFCKQLSSVSFAQKYHQSARFGILFSKFSWWSPEPSCLHSKRMDPTPSLSPQASDSWSLQLLDNKFMGRASKNKYLALAVVRGPCCPTIDSVNFWGDMMSNTLVTLPIDIASKYDIHSYSECNWNEADKSLNPKQKELKKIKKNDNK